jgi:hypothetical protein
MCVWSPCPGEIRSYICVWSACPGEIWPYVCVSGAPDRERSAHRVYDQISPGQQLQTHIQTDDYDIRMHTVQTHNERTSTEFNLVTAESTAHEPPEDGRKYGPKHVGAISLKCF